MCRLEPDFRDGPPPSKTGAPGPPGVPDEETCQECHNTYPLNDPSGGVTIDGLPASYLAGGDPIPFTVTVFQDGTGAGERCPSPDCRIDWGFELTVLDANNAFAGNLVATDMTNTQIVPGDGDYVGRFYIEQTIDGIFYNQDGAPSATWGMAWVPPATDMGPVTFYVAGNSANGDASRSGDYIFTANQTVLGGGAIAGALSLSDRRHVPKGMSPTRCQGAARATFLGPRNYWHAFASRRNGVAPVVAPASAHRNRG